MHLFGILKIALGVPESTEGFWKIWCWIARGDACTASSVQGTSRGSGEKMLTGLLWVLRRGRGEELREGGLWGGLKGYIGAGLPWIKPFLCFIICEIM